MYNYFIIFLGKRTFSLLLIFLLIFSFLLLDRLVKSLRNLYQRNELSGKNCSFWEGAFGHMKHIEKTASALKAAVDSEEGVFHGVNMFQWMFSAMFQRDCEAIETVVKQYSGLNVYEIAIVITELSFLWTYFLPYFYIARIPPFPQAKKENIFIL